MSREEEVRKTLAAREEEVRLKHKAFLQSRYEQEELLVDLKRFFDFAKAMNDAEIEIACARLEDVKNADQNPRVQETASIKQRILLLVQEIQNKGSLKKTWCFRRALELSSEALIKSVSDYEFVFGYKSDRFELLQGLTKDQLRAIALDESVRLGLNAPAEKVLPTERGTLLDYSKNTLRKAPINWLLFYTYVFLPLGILQTVILFFVVPFDSLTNPYRFLIQVFLLNGVLLVAVMGGLHFRKLWAWRLNWVVIGFHLIFGFFAEWGDMSEGWGGLILVLLFRLAMIYIYFALSWRYFMKRRCLFV